MKIEDLAKSLGGAQRSGSGWLARCPAHADGRPSLSITSGSGQSAVLHCFAGCEFPAIMDGMRAKGVDTGDWDRDRRKPLPYVPPVTSSNETTYEYTDDDGLVLYSQVRVGHGKDKRFRRVMPTGSGKGKPAQPTLYRRPWLKEARDRGARVFVVEGEKDCETLVAQGIPYVTTSGGADSWRPEFADLLEGCEVIVLPDNDVPGQKYAARILESLPRATVLKLKGCEEHEDVTDWLNKGHTIPELMALVDGAGLSESISLAASRDLGEFLRRPVEAIPTPFPTWNELCGSMGGHKGLALGWFVVVAGPTGNGKTRLARQLVRHAMREGYSTGYVALEGGKEDLHVGIVSLGQPHAYKLRPGPNFPHAEWDRMAQAFDAELVERDVQFRFTTKPRQLPDVLAAMAEMVERGCRMIVVDYFQLVHVSGADIYAKTAEVAAALQRFAVENRVVVLALSQFNRQATTSDEPLTVYGLAGGGAIENSCDQILIIDNRKPDREPGAMRGFLTLAKNRHGAPTEGLGFRVVWNWHDNTIKEAAK